MWPSRLRASSNPDPPADMEHLGWRLGWRLGWWLGWWLEHLEWMPTRLDETRWKMRALPMGMVRQARELTCERQSAGDYGEHRQAAGATNSPLMPRLVFLSGVQHLARLGIDKVNPPASGTRHRLVGFAICQIIGHPALHLLAGSWAAVSE
jgi:hypothetical protein